KRRTDVTLAGQAPAPTTIVFGTDGWRARIADDFTYENVRRCADGVAAYVVGRGEQSKGVVIAYDRRFSSEHFALAAAEVLLAHGRIRVDEIHQERNPYFGGVNPEPIRPNIDEALGLLAGGGYDLGLFLDGDADRAGAADERGTFVHQLEVTGLLMYHLAEHRGLREPVVVSVNNTS